MATTTKREIAERVAQQTGLAQVAVKQVVQMLFEEIVKELAAGNRLEFRDFGVFEVVGWVCWFQRGMPIEGPTIQRAHCTRLLRWKLSHHSRRLRRR